MTGHNPRSGGGRQHRTAFVLSCVRVFVGVLVVGVPRLALACPVCFGNSDAPMAKATNDGVIFMLAIVALMLTAFASFFIYLYRRAKRIADGTDPAEVARLQPTEGSAQC